MSRLNGDPNALRGTHHEGNLYCILCIHVYIYIYSLPIYM